jgi:hypothetical protein
MYATVPSAVPGLVSPTKKLKSGTAAALGAGQELRARRHGHDIAAAKITGRCTARREASEAEHMVQSLPWEQQFIVGGRCLRGRAQRRC